MKKRIKLIAMTFLLLFVLSGFFSVIFGENVFVLGKNKLLRLAGVYTEAIPSVTINQTGYDQQTPGTWGITKSAKWKGKGKAEVTFDVQSIMKSGDNHKDIILVMDISGSMSGEKLEKAKQDSIELVESILSDSNNRISFITFDSTSTIVSPFTNNKETLINQIQNISDRGATNYNSGLKNAKEVLEGYQKQSNKDLVLLFLTDGYPNIDIHNEIATYQILKEKYPYMTIQGIQYEMGTEIHDDIKNISDNQFIADMTILENVLFEASIAPYLYENFVITDYIHDDYFTVGSVDDIKVSYGSVQLVPEGTGQKVIWDLSGLYRSGSNVQMKINLTVKQQYAGGEGFYPTNKGEDISSQLPEEEVKTKNSDQTPVLQSRYQLVYDSNVPTGCSNQDLPTEKHMMYEIVEKKDTELTCPGYQFKGWFYDLEDEKDIQKVNDDTFIMPEHDVTIRAQWTKHNIEKSMDGTIHIVRKVTNLYTDGTLIINDEDINANITKHGAIVKEYPGFSDDQPYVFTYKSSTDHTILWYNERLQIKRVKIGEKIKPTSTDYWFYNARNMEEGDFTNLDTSNVTSMSYMFSDAGRNATTFDIGDLSSWDTSKVTDMRYMFSYAGYNATTFDIGDLSGWDTSKVTNMGIMFEYAGYNATTWSIGNLSSWDTSKVTNMGTMFSYAGGNATTFDIGDLSGWDTSQVTSMSYMFQSAGGDATDWNIGDLSGWDTSQVKSMSNMFNYAGRNSSTFDIGDLSGWDTSQVTSMSNMFSAAGYNATTFEIGDLSGWDTSNVKNMSNMFSHAGYSATTWSIGDLSGWDTSNVTNMGSMFYSAGRNATTFKLDLSNWNTSKVTNMNPRFSEMFSYAGYNAKTFELNLSGWDTSKVTDMSRMFYSAGRNATTFKLDLSNWNTSKVTNMSEMFGYTGYSATIFELNLLGWDTSQATNMQQMFNYAGRNATTFKLDLSNWNTSQVTNMSFMFSDAGRNATTFDIGDLSGWDTSQVTNMSSMFSTAGYSTTTWNIGNLSSWDTSKVTNMSFMFSTAGKNATTWSIGNLSSWDTSQVTNMSGMFSDAGYNATTWNIGDLSSWDTSKVTNMNSMFSEAGYSAKTFDIGDLSGWDTSQVTNMSSMFSTAGYSSTTWSIGDLSGWDTSKVTNMDSMFKYAGGNATTWNSIGNLKVYATTTDSMFSNCGKANATLMIYRNPTSYSSMFSSTATSSGSGITVNYSSATKNIDAMINTKSSNSNVVKGVQID